MSPTAIVQDLDLDRPIATNTLRVRLLWRRRAGASRRNGSTSRAAGVVAGPH